ncbi:MAG: hypothetical protein ACR2ML_11380 [Solirubrobacteraceae bacterium]
MKARARARAIAAGAAALTLLGGCGGPSADLFVVERSGAIPGARLSLLVSDGGTARCNGGAPRDIGSARLIDARALVTDLEAQAARNRTLPPSPGAVLRYRVRMEAGTLAFADTSRGQPPAFQRLAAFTREVAMRVCRLPR